MNDGAPGRPPKTPADARWRSVPARCLPLWRAVQWRVLRFWTEEGGGFGWKIYLRLVRARATLRRRFLSRQTLFVGITGSAGKTTAKDLVASILDRHLAHGQRGIGGANGSYHVAQVVLRTARTDAFAVTEIALPNDESIERQLDIFRPNVGLVTTVGGDHYSAYGSLDAIAREKGRLVRALPAATGVAILNADDPRVLAMRSLAAGRVVTFGTDERAMLRGTRIDSSWPDTLSLTATWQGGAPVRVTTQLCGTHFAPVVLGALATGVALGVPLEAAAAAVAGVPPVDGRMSPVRCADGVTFIRDDWKAPYWSIPLALQFVREARAKRKIVIIGTISDCPGDSSRRYAQVARNALEVADCVIFVGNQATAALRSKRDADEMLFAFPSVRDAARHLSKYLASGDLVLLKGSTRTDHLERLLLDRTGSVECWRERCGWAHYCDACPHVHTPFDVLASANSDTPDSSTPRKPKPVAAKPTLVIVGLGNPDEALAASRHNVGHMTVDMLARRLAKNWRVQGNARLCDASTQSVDVHLVKPLAQMNDIGPALAQIADDLDVDAASCVLVHDDVDLPIGSVRVRNRGGDGGHNGVRSILQTFQDDRFRRVKIGIGKPPPGQPFIDHVLGAFTAGERECIDEAQGMAADRLLEIIERTSAEQQARSKSATEATPGKRSPGVRADVD